MFLEIVTPETILFSAAVKSITVSWGKRRVSNVK